MTIQAMNILLEVNLLPDTWGTRIVAGCVLAAVATAGVLLLLREKRIAARAEKAAEKATEE